MNIEILNNLEDVGLETRPNGSKGYWCSVLLPLILIFNSLTYNVTSVYEVTTIVSLGLLSSSVLLLLNEIQKWRTTLCLTCAVVMYLFTNQGLPFCIFASFTSIFLYNYFLQCALKDFPKTFTIGEAMVVTQGLVLFITSAGLCRFIERDNIDVEQQFFQTFFLTILFTVIFLVAALYYLNNRARNMKSLGVIICAGASLEIVLLFVFLGKPALPRILMYLFGSYDRIRIILLWLLLVLIAVIMLIIQTRLNIKASTSTRKTFHILASAVFLIGLLSDFNLMLLAAGIAFALLIFVEALRKSRIEPISSALQSAFVTYSDEKDCGVLAMTPIYLFCGLACPILLVPADEGFTLELLSGVLSIGVGDTAASFFGSRYGRIKWPGTNKTVEGMVCNTLSQLLLVFILDIFAFLPPANNIPRSVVAATTSALVEINTDQVDNLILPLVMYATLQITTL